MIAKIKRCISNVITYNKYDNKYYIRFSKKSENDVIWHMYSRIGIILGDLGITEFKLYKSMRHKDTMLVSIELCNVVAYSNDRAVMDNYICSNLNYITSIKNIILNIRHNPTIKNKVIDSGRMIRVECSPFHN